MYKPRYIQYINLPMIPADIVSGISRDLQEYKTVDHGNYHWSDSHNQALNAWAQKNICNDMHFAFQVMTGDLPVHKDIGTKTKFVYILETGGANVVTKFWDDDHCLLDQYVIEPHRWHILKADTFHSVDSIEENCARWSVTGRIF